MSAPHVSIRRCWPRYILPPMAREHMLVINHQHLGRGSTNKNPCLRSGLKLQMESLEVLRDQLFGMWEEKAMIFTTWRWKTEDFAIKRKGTKDCCYDVQIHGRGIYSSNSSSLYHIGSRIASWTPCFSDPWMYSRNFCRKISTQGTRGLSSRILTTKLSKASFLPFLELAMSCSEGTDSRVCDRSQEWEAEACDPFGRNGLSL